MKEISEIKVNLTKIIENEQQNNEQSFESDSNPSEDELEDEQMVKILPKSVYSKKQTKILQQIREREKEAKKKEIYSKKIQRKSEVFHTYEV